MNKLYIIVNDFDDWAADLDEVEIGKDSGISISIFNSDCQSVLHLLNRQRCRGAADPSEEFSGFLL